MFICSTGQQTGRAGPHQTPPSRLLLLRDEPDTVSTFNELQSQVYTQEFERLAVMVVHT